MNLSIAFDPASLSRIAGLSEVGPALDARLTGLLPEVLDTAEAEAQAYMWATFKNPQGSLEGAFEQVINGLEGILENTSPYAWRRDQGFSGMTDSLGRFFPSDPGIGYMAYAFSQIEASGEILGNLSMAVLNSFRDVGVL